MDDLLLQVLLDACVGLEEGDTNSSAGRTKSPGVPSPLGMGTRWGHVEPGEDEPLPKEAPPNTESSAKGLRPQRSYHSSKHPGNLDGQGLPPALTLMGTLPREGGGLEGLGAVQGR